MRAQKRKSFYVSLKLNSIEPAEKHYKEVAAVGFGINVRRIREWCGQKELAALKIKASPSEGGWIEEEGKQWTKTVAVGCPCLLCC